MLSFLELKIPSNVCSLKELGYGLQLADHDKDINSELDELDREEFYRLKKVSGKKQRDNAASDAEILAARQREAEQQKNGNAPSATAEEPEAADVLGEQEDTDVIF